MDVREQLLEVAQGLIQREGLDAVSFRTLADVVGIKSASVHYHFPKKDDLVVELTRRYTIAFGGALAEIEKSKKTARTRLRGLVELFRKTNDEDKICYCATIAIVSTRLGAESRSEAQTFFAVLRDWVERILRQGVKQEEFGLALNPKIVARSFIATLEGALLIDHLEETSANLEASKRLIDSLLAA